MEEKKTGNVDMLGTTGLDIVLKVSKAEVAVSDKSEMTKVQAKEQLLAKEKQERFKKLAEWKVSGFSLNNDLVRS